MRTRSQARVFARLEALPLPAREEVVLLLTTVDGDSIYEQEQIAKALEVMRALPLVSQGTLTALRELRLPIGRLRASTVDEAVRQAAHKPRPCLGRRHGHTRKNCPGADGLS